MINRIRDIRKEKGLTLAQVAAACNPPTTAQTIGRLETGTRKLSLEWMNTIAAALAVEPNLLVRGGAERAGQPQIVARLTDSGAEALSKPRDAILPTALGGEAPLICLAIEATQGEYRSGDQVWLRQHPPEDASRLVNRDVLCPRSGGRFAFGRLINREGSKIGLLPPFAGQLQVIVDNPPWIAVAEMLVRRL